MKKLLLSILVLSVTFNLTVLPTVYAALSQGDITSIYNDTTFYDPDSNTCTSQTVTTPSNGNGIYMIGDSLTVGMNRESLGAESISSLMQRNGWAPTINAQGCRPLYNTTNPNGFEGNGTGCPAGTITSAFNELAKDQEAIRSAAKIVVALGTNNYEGSQEVFRQKAREYIQELRTLNPGIGNNIYWVNLYTKGGGLSERSQVISEVVQENGIQLVDFRSVATDETTYSYPSNDSTHHDQNGYVNKAKFIVDKLGTSTAAPSTAPSGAAYDPLSLTYPAFPDEATIARGIEDTIRARKASSPWLAIPNFGTTLLEKSKAVNINPLFVVASGNIESGFGTSPVATAHNNSFGMKASGSTYRDFPTMADGIWAFVNEINRALAGETAGGRYKEARTIYEYFSIHQTGGIHYPGDGMNIYDPAMDVYVSWDPNANSHKPGNPQYNPLIYYKRNIEIINQVTGLSLPTDQPPLPGAGTTISVCSGSTLGAGAPLPAGAGGYDLPNEGTNPLVYYSQLNSGNDNSVQGYFGLKDYGIGSIQECGCGPTSMAMVVSTLTSNKIDPEQMAKWAYERGFQNTPQCGSKWFWEDPATTNTYDISIRALTGPSDIAASLQQGKLVIASVSSFPLPSNRAGHITVIRKYENQQFYFADPYSEGWLDVEDVSRRPYTADEIASMINKVWEVSSAQ